MEYLRSISEAPKLAGVETYMAGASLFLPIVMKKSEMSWKESSSTVSTDISQHCLSRRHLNQIV